MIDRRLWYPDETCRPFVFESGVQAADLFLGRFSVPSECEAVIASVFTQTSLAAVKSTQRVVIAKGAGDPLDRSRDINVTGALLDAQEIDSSGPSTSGGNRAVGFILPLGSCVRPVRIVLESGPYEVYHVGTTGIASLCFSGWLYPINNRR